MSPESMALSLMQLNTIDWPATAGMLTVISIVAGGIGAIIAAVVVRPMIDKAIDGAVDRLVSKELFNAFKETDKNEHAAIQSQLNTITARLK